MTDNNKNRLRVSSARKLKPCSTPANDDLNGSIKEKLSNKKAKKTGNENDVLLYPNSACSPEESVFSIDHILESIFAALDRESLLNCRRLSRRWMYFSSFALQKIITLKFEHTYKDKKSASNQQVLLCNGKKERSIKELVTLMNNSTNFPCRSFSFHNHCKESNSLAQRFLNSHGTFISKLEFGGYLDLTDLKRLLLSQAPNLEQLVLKAVEFTCTYSESRCNKLETCEEGSPRLDSLFKESTIGPVFKNLQVFTCDAYIPHIFLQQLLQCSPNLVEVFVKPKFLHCLVQPVNRLHLLRKLDVEIEQANPKSLKTLGNNTRPESWAIGDVQFLNYSAYEEPFPETLSKILKSCSQTCQTLSWNDQFRHFQIPSMPGVRHFSLQYFENWNPLQPVNLFPEGVSLEETFPNLTSLEISSDSNMINLSTVYIFGDDNPLPLMGVQKVFLRFCAGKRLIQSFQTMFPNAAITEAE